MRHTGLVLALLLLVTACVAPTSGPEEVTFPSVPAQRAAPLTEPVVPTEIAKATSTPSESVTPPSIAAVTRTATLASPTTAPMSAPFHPRVEVVATNLVVPWALSFAPDGRLFFTERPGRIRVVVDGRLVPDPVAEIAVYGVGEGGLLGLALDPAFESNGRMYIMYTYDSGGQPANRISRMTFAGGRAAEERVLLDGIPGARFHDGGRLAIGPDAKLYATVGDARDPDLAQQLDSLAGKILRMNLDGSVPDDNPFPGSLIYSGGHRNPQGLAWQPETGVLWSTEHGPSGEFGLCCRDELNRIVPGGNYGWPIVTAIAGDSRYVDPVTYSGDSVTWAPGSVAFVTGDQLGPWRGNAFYGALRGEHLGRVALGGPGRDDVLEVERLYEGEYGRIREVTMGPDGYLYFSTSNRDGRGRPSGKDDRILRVVPGP